MRQREMTVALALMGAPCADDTESFQSWQAKKCRAGHKAPSCKLVEAAGQLFHRFRGRLDYAFIPACRDAGRVIRTDTANPSAGSGTKLPQPVYESLQGTPG